MKIAIGAAQFGAAYGISNRHGKPPIAEVSRIIHLARDSRINTIDTAVGYKGSNAALAAIGVEDFKICTKISLKDISDPYNLNQVYDTIAHSRHLLNIRSFHSLLWHHTDELLNENSGRLVDMLIKLKKDGITRKIGYSIYNFEQLDDLIGILKPDTIQVPFNVFDQRALSSGLLDSTLSEGVEIHARSLFLQGLLLLKQNSRPAYFDRWRTLFSRWEHFVADSNPIPICIAFAQQYSRFDRLVVGVNSANELKEILDSLDHINLPDLSYMAAEDPELLEPFRWKV